MSVLCHPSVLTVPVLRRITRRMHGNGFSPANRANFQKSVNVVNPTDANMTRHFKSLFLFSDELSGTFRTDHNTDCGIRGFL